MTTPSELLGRALADHGDTIYRVALLLGGDEARAADLLLALVADALAAPPLAAPDEAELVARLAAVARQQKAKEAGRRAAPRPPAGLPALYRALLALPLGQRQALGLHLLLGYDAERLGRSAGDDPAAARARLLAAARAIAPAAGVSLTDRTSGDHCDAVRDALIDPAGRLRHAPAIRGHLASCALCRSFDQAWGELSQAVEAALRESLRDRALPAPLEARLLAAARPRRRLADAQAWRLWRFLLPPLAVLALIAALVLPGIGRPAVTVVDREAAAPVDSQTLIARALDIHSRPSAGPGQIWHASYQTFWYFDNATLAPLRAEIWLDSANPARHRLQISHADGGAPYELQIGGGADRLYYALDATYARALYGSLPTRASDEGPALISQSADPAAQAQALRERISYGVWDIPPFYLRQAQAARDLRVLGRQRDGERTVQILSFSGVSPMGHPADAPGATAERVTVLLALDTLDGRLRSATELAGPAGGAQTSRVTWQLVDEEWLRADPVSGAPFNIGRAWNGRGEFPDASGYRAADQAMPLIGAGSLGEPARLLAPGAPPLWAPSAPPAGADRALLLWPNLGGAPQALIYLGPDRRLSLRFNTATRIAAAEELAIGPWQARLEPGRARGYRAVIQRPGGGPGAQMLLEAHGFSRAELVAVIESLRPFDAATLAAQDAIFVRPAAADPAARAALIGLLREPPAAAERVSYQRGLIYRLRSPRVDPRLDPYHLPPDDGLPEPALYEIWRYDGDGRRASLLRVSDPADPARYRLAYDDDRGGWDYSSASDAAAIRQHDGRQAAPSFDLLKPALLGLLISPGDALSIAPSSGGGALISRRQLSPDLGPYQEALRASLDSPAAAVILSDPNVVQLVTELQLAADGRPAELRTLLASALPGAAIVLPPGSDGQPGLTLAANGPDSPGGGLLLYSLGPFASASVSLDEAPAELRSGQPPAAAITRDKRSSRTQDVSWLQLASPAEAAGLVGAPYYALPSELAPSMQIELHPGEPQPGFDQGTTSIDAAVAAGYAVRTTYQMPTADAGTYPLRVTQGAAEELGAFLASSLLASWERSEPQRLTIGGRELNGWIASGGGALFLIAEVDGQLLIIEGPQAQSAESLGALAAALRPEQGE